MEPIPNTTWVTRNLGLKSPGAWRITNTTIFLDECSDKMTPNDILLYSQIIVLLRHHQRSLLLKQMGTNTETTARKYAENENLETLSPKKDVSIKSFPSGFKKP